jgi:putative ABC transport system permease protein
LRIDFRVLTAAIAFGVLSALLFGMLPAFRSGRIIRVHTSNTSRWQPALVGLEVALAFVLLTGAGLLLRTFAAVRGADLGYDYTNVLTHFLALPPSSDGTNNVGLETFDRIRRRIAALPGVTGVATASRLPMFGVTMTMDVQPEGQPARKNPNRALLSVISEDYLRVMRIPLRKGRAFTPFDRDGSTRVALVSESIARRHFESNAIGRRLVLPTILYNIDGGEETPVEIVGVVGNVAVNSVDDRDAEQIYVPERQNVLRMENLVIRTAGDPWLLAKSIRTAVLQESPETPLDEAQTLEQRVSYLIDGPRRAMWLLGVFAGLALSLAALGIYGVATYLATQRRQEMAIRMSLGAQRLDILRHSLSRAIAASAAGLGIGLVAALALTRTLEASLVGVRPHDPLTLTWSAIALLTVSILAAWLPALRAARMDPLSVLRSE